MIDRIYTLAELAERWRCKIKTIYNMVESGKLRAFKVGREYRVKAAEVLRFEGGEDK